MFPSFGIPLLMKSSSSIGPDPFIGGLLAAYLLDSNVLDATGNGHNGTVINGPVTYVTGVNGQAAQGGGSPAVRVNIPGIGALPTAWTITARVKVFNYSPTYSVIVGSVANSRGILISNDGHFGYFHGASVDYGTTGGPLNDAGDIIIPLNTWWHVAVSYDGTTMRTYVNGVYARYSTVSYGSFPDIFEPSYLLSSTGGFWPSAIDGLVDDVCIFNTAKTDAEIAAIATGGPYVGPYVEPLLTDLVSYYEFNGNTNDSHGSNNLTPFGGPGWTTGIVNQALSTTPFYGSGFYSGGINLGTTWSISLWVKPQSTITGGGPGVIRAELLLDSGSLGLYAIPSGFSWAITTNVPAYDSGVGYTIGQWTHIVATYDGTTLRFYVNGVAGNTHTVSIPAFAPATIRSGNAAPVFDGPYDELGLWNRELSATNVAQLFNGSSALAYPF